MIKRNPRIKRNYEIWKPIEGFPDYEISNMGRIKSLERYVKYKDGRNRLIAEKLLKYGNSKGYRIANLFYGKKHFYKAIHILVLIHFIGPKPTPIHQGNHEDSDILNNWWTNLNWMTPKENTNHAIIAGVSNDMKGENNWNSKLTKQQVKEIRKLHSTKRYTQREIGKIFGLRPNYVGEIIRYNLWKNI